MFLFLIFTAWHLSRVEFIYPIYFVEILEIASPILQAGDLAVSSEVPPLQVQWM